MNVRVGVKSDIGRSRERNEDSFLTEAPLFAVADGMGGHRGGDVASSLALETLHSLLEHPGASELLDTVRKANIDVLERGESDRDLRGMGTTLTAVLTDGDKAHVVHVGDSRAYLLRDGQLQQLTEDHTLVQRMVREGRITQEEAEHHPQRSILTRALGVDRVVEADPLTMDVLPGDRLMLCTDGLTAMVERGRIHEILGREHDPQAACDALVAAANEAGGEDNITVLVLDFEQDRQEDGPQPPADAAAPGRGQVRNGVAPGEAPAQVSTPTGGPSAAIEEPAAGRRRWPRLALWTGLIALVVVAAVIGIRIYVHHQWYVGESAGRVAIFNGIPTKVLGLHLSRVHETTDLPSVQAETLAPWRSLHDGITADSLSDARAIVAQIRQDLQGQKAGSG